MNKLAIRLCLVMALLLLSVPGMAQIDITDYMMLTPGHWKTFQGEDVCQGSTWEEAVMISTNHRRLRQFALQPVIGRCLADCILMSHTD